jgi:hypothetical protein
MLTAAKATEIYEDTIRDLRAAIEAHVTPSGKNSTKAFCEAYDINRANLVRCLTGNNGRELSVGLFQKISQHLGILPAATIVDNEAFYNISLKAYILINNNAIYSAILTLNR